MAFANHRDASDKLPSHAPQAMAKKQAASERPVDGAALRVGWKREGLC